MIRIENLQFAYDRKSVLKDVDLTLEKGRIYGLLGKNGVGKTTLLKLMSGLLKKDGGMMEINGYDPFKRQPGFLSDMYFLPEDVVVPKMKIIDFVKGNGKMYPNFDYDLFENLAGQMDVDINGVLNKLSLGQQKKTMICYALSLRTSILLLDEPSNGLDIPSKSALRKIISQCASEDNVFVISTHQVRDLENLIDPIIIMDNDGILLNASIEEIASKLSFSMDSKPAYGALFSEPVLGGYMNVTMNDSGEESKVNIETLFETAIAKKDYFKAIFRGDKKKDCSNDKEQEGGNTGVNGYNGDNK